MFLDIAIQEKYLYRLNKQSFEYIKNNNGDCLKNNFFIFKGVLSATLQTSRLKSFQFVSILAFIESFVFEMCLVQFC